MKKMGKLILSKLFNDLLLRCIIKFTSPQSAIFHLLHFCAIFLAHGCSFVITKSGNKNYRNFAKTRSPSENVQLFERKNNK